MNAETLLGENSVYCQTNQTPLFFRPGLTLVQDLQTIKWLNRSITQN